MYGAAGKPRNPIYQTTVEQTLYGRNVQSHENDDIGKMTRIEEQKRNYNQDLMHQIEERRLRKEREKNTQLQKEIEEETKYNKEQEEMAKKEKEDQEKAKCIAYKKELQEQVDAHKRKKEDEKRRYRQEELEAEEKWKREQEVVTKREQAEKEQERNKYKNFQVANQQISTKNETIPNRSPNRISMERPDAQNSVHKQNENASMPIIESMIINSEPPFKKIDPISTEISKQYILSQRQSTEQSFASQAIIKKDIEAPPFNAGGNQHIAEMYNQQMNSHVTNLKGEMNNMQTDLLSQINFLKQQTNQAILERDRAQLELRNIQGQFNNHLTQNEIYKENMNEIFKKKLETQQETSVNNFVNKYSGITGKEKLHQEIYDIIDDPNSGKVLGNKDQNFGNINRSKSEPMRFFGKQPGNDDVGTYNTANFGAGLMQNNSSGTEMLSQKYGSLQGQSNFVPLKFFDKSQMNANEFTLGKQSEMRFSKDEFKNPNESQELGNYKAQDDMMFESTTKEFEKLLNGEKTKQRPYTHQNLRDSQKYLNNRSMGENNGRANQNEGNFSRNQTFKHMGKNLLDYHSTRDIDQNNFGSNTFGKKKNANYVDTGINDTQNNTEGIKNDSVLGILEKYGEVQFDSKKDNLKFFGNDSQGAVQNDSMVRQSMGLNDIIQKNEKRMTMLNNFEKQLNLKDSNKFDTDEQSKLVGDFGNNNLDFGSKGLPKSNDSLGIRDNNSYGVKLAESSEFNLGTLENQLNKYKDIKI